MSDKKCGKCGFLFNHHDKVKAEIFTHYITLKSKAVFALEKPYDCSKIEHIHCNYPQTGCPEGD